MNDVKRARKILDEDPQGALALLEKHPMPAPGVGGDGAKKEVERSGMRVDLYERLGRHDAAAAEQAALTRYLEWLLEHWDRRAAADKDKDWMPKVDLGSKANVLELLGRPSEAARCKLFAADLLLARYGDAGAKASLKAAATAGVSETGNDVPGLGLVGALMDLAGHDKSVFAASARATSKKLDRGLAGALRDKLLSEGRAVAFARCGTCGGVVTADYKTCRCVGGHEVDGVRVVVLEDAPAAWYADPWKRSKFRFWNGGAWTSKVASGGKVAEDPPGDPDAKEPAG